MKKPFIIGTVAALTIANTGVTGIASTLDNPRQEAEHVIVDQVPADEQEIQERGPAYADEFLAAFHQLSTTYEQVFRQGVADAEQGYRRAPGGSNLVEVAYQRGWERGQQLIAAASPVVPPTQSPVPAVSSFDPGQSLPPTTDLPADQGSYAVQKPTNSQRLFINRLATVAQQVGAEYDLYPSVIIAQAALESDWGNSRLGRAPFHNLFGVKGYFAGQTTSQVTGEYQDGRHLMIVDNFRRYQNDYEALQDYAQTLQAPLYRGVHRQNAPTYRQATHALQGRYATDPQYEQKLNQLIEGYQLTRYDHQPRQSESGHQSPVKVKVTESQVPKSMRHPKPAHRKAGHHHFPTIISIASGAGSAGLIELGRRIFFK